MYLRCEVKYYKSAGLKQYVLINTFLKFPELIELYLYTALP